MKMNEALEIINSKPKGFMVTFEWAKDGMLTSDHFPDKNGGEKLILNEEEAWDLARKFAKKTLDKCVNIYVVDDEFNPVPLYKERTIRNRV
jgi:hypothetical protein